MLENVSYILTDKADFQFSDFYATYNDGFF